jgi:tetratricopeptide (TPR) repeat protein
VTTGALTAISIALTLAATPPAQQPHAIAHAPGAKSKSASAQPGSPTSAGAPESSAPSLATSPKFLERAEPNLEQGARLLASGDVDGAIEKFHKAEPRDGDERAIVEYDVGSAQLDRAVASAENAQPASPGAAAAQNGANAPKIDKSALDDAKASFERAFGLAKDPRIKSEAALAAGNAAARGNDVDEAIAQYRKAVVADPTNARAKTNLRRVLDAKRAQPPPPPQKNDNNDDKKKNDDKNDAKKDGDKKDQKKDGDKNDQQKKDGDDKKDQQQQQQQQNEKKDQQPSPQDQSPEAQKQRKKDAAKRLLDAMRARERPLTPLEQRGQERQQRAKDGKDW